MRLPCVAVLAMALGLSGCGGSGAATDGFFAPQISDAYIPLHKGNVFSGEGSGAAVVIAPGVAVTCAHNADSSNHSVDIVDDASVIGRSKDYDLLYFRTDRTSTLATATPFVGEKVIAYGQSNRGGLRIAYGVVTLADPKSHGLAFDADAGPGFSGGPVLDAKTGALLGITFGYMDDQPGVKGQLMYAYDMQRVAIELANLGVKKPQ